MDFFEHQDRARARSRRLYALYALALLGVVLTLNAVVLCLVHINHSNSSARYASFDRPASISMQGEIPQLVVAAAITTMATLAIIGIATAFKVAQLGGDGAHVAEMLGGRPIVGRPDDLDERKLVNVVEEMSIASGVPMPRLYLMDAEEGINAFAAGTRSEAAVIGVTRGAIADLSRDELQGVIAHEFSHILNGDMRINLRLIGLNFGLIALGYLGLQTFRLTAQLSPRGRSSSSNDKKDNTGAIVIAILLVALAMTVVGYIGTLFGKMLQAAVSRQREFLADASAVQFTRNPRGVGGALRKIGGLETGSRLVTPAASEASHMFFADGVVGWLDSVFATHPPLEQRIRAIDPTLLTEPASTVGRAGSFGSVQPIAGFAGLIASNRVRAEPNGLADVDRGLAPVQVAAAARLIEGLPPVLLDLAREPYGARAVALGLLLELDESLQASQLERIASVDSDLAQLVARYAAEFASVDAGARLPLLDRALPSLRQLSTTQLATFRSLCQALAEADADVSPFETAMLVVLDHELGLLRSSESQGSAPRTLDAAADAIGVVLSTLAIAGGADQADAAFSRGVERIRVSSIPQRRARFDAVPFRVALSQLRRSPLNVRRALVDAATYCVAADGTVGIAELELMRAISAALDVSIPPLLTTREDVQSPMLR